MFEPNSRYYTVEKATYAAEDGEEITYVKRRFLPHGAAQPHLVDVVVADGDRLDLIADRILGDPEQFWRICDANDAMNPFDLTAEPGVTLRVNVPQVNS